MTSLPTVAVVLPVLDGAEHIDACLASVSAQTYPAIIEVLVLDGGSTDGTVERAAAHAGVRVVHNPSRRQSAAMNLAIAEASADVIARIDVRTRFTPNYVERAVDALCRTGAGIVGGAQVAVGSGFPGAGIALAFGSRLGAGTAAFRRADLSTWTDTAYLGVFRREDALAIGGYDLGLPTNEDADFARRMGVFGGAWLDGGVRSTYEVRTSFLALGRQYRAYGRGRGQAIASDGSDVGVRHLLAPGLLLGLLSPWRRTVALAYGASVALVAGRATSSPADRVAMAFALPVMHLTWGIGIVEGVAAARRDTGTEPPSR